VRRRGSAAWEDIHPPLAQEEREGKALAQMAHEAAVQRRCHAGPKRASPEASRRGFAAMHAAVERAERL
jgi:hypothetical protein